MQMRFALALQENILCTRIKDNDKNSPAKVFCAAYAEEEYQKHLALTLQVLPKSECKMSKQEKARRIFTMPLPIWQYLLSAAKWLAQTRNPELVHHLPQKYTEVKSP